MLKFQIPVVWESWGVKEVEADNLQEALRLLGSGEVSLPEGSVVSGSLRIDDKSNLYEEFIKEYMKHENDRALV